MSNEEFINELFEKINQVKTADIEMFFGFLEENIKSNMNDFKDINKALEVTKALKNVVISQRKQAFN